MSVGIQSIRSLSEHPGLSKEVQRQLKFADWQTFVVAMTVLVGGGLLIANPNSPHDAQLAASGFIGAVVTYFFSNKITVSSAAATIAAQQTAAPQTAANGGTKP